MLSIVCVLAIAPARWTAQQALSFIKTIKTNKADKTRQKQLVRHRVGQNMPHELNRVRVPP